MLRAGQVSDARILLQEHVSRRRNDHEAFAILAQLATIERQYDDAESHIRKALRGDRRRADYHALYAELLTTQGRFRDAIARYDQALKGAPGYEAAVAGKAEVYLRMGQPERALQVAEKGPDRPSTAVPRARAMVRLGRAEEAAALARRHLPARDASADVQRGLWFVLGRAEAATGRYAEAADAFRAGNDLSARGWAAEGDEHRNAMLMETFTTEAMPTLPRASNTDDRPVFVVGLLRSGSTLVEQILDAHPQAAGVGEIETLPRLIVGMQEHLGTRLPWPALLSEANELGMSAVANAYLAELDRLAPDAARVIDKQLGNFMHLGAIQLLFPAARVIHCTRHPMDLGLSCWEQKLPPGTNAWAADLTAIGQTWRLTEALMQHWRATLDLPVLEVRYESLVRDLDAEVHRILDFCDLPFDPACLRFWETGRTVLTLSSDQVRRPIYASSVGRHEPWGTHLAPLQRALGDAVERYESQG
jgi:tetratricopeptide (TPR) repeat protein